jgi:hypothetical protein
MLKEDDVLEEVFLSWDYWVVIFGPRVGWDEIE